jgi:iron complex outermembrane recepter protein
MKISQLALATALFSVSSTAYADAGESKSQTIIVTGTSAVTAAKNAADQTPGGTDVISYQDYADKSLLSLRDTLAYSPGIYLQPRYGQEIRISIRGSGLSRGFHMRGLTLLQDGIPINLADDNGDFQELEPTFFDHLEVYRGANALHFGSGTLGGAINGVTPTGQTAPGIYARADAGSFNSLRGFLSVGTKAGAGDVWAAVSKDTSDGDRANAKRDSLRLHGNVGLQISDAVKTRFYASFNNINQSLPGALTRAQVLTAPEMANPGSVAGNQARDIDSLRLQNRTSFDFGTLKLDIGAFLNAKSLYHPIYQVIDQESTDRGVFARADFEQGPFAFTLGGEARFGDITSKRFVNIAGKRGALTFQADQEARTANIYGEARFKPAGAVTLIAGGIYADGYRAQHELFNSGPRDIRARAEFSEFSPKFGLLIDANPDIQFFANYSRSAEFPGFIELAQVSQFVPVKAQTAWAGEIGTRGTAGIASWDITAYRADLSGELLQFTVAADIPAATFNAGKTRHQGIEAALTLQPTDWLRLKQVYQYSDFAFRADTQYGNNRLPVVPPHVYRAELRLGTDALHIAPNIEWVPKGAFADYRNTTRTSAYTLIGLTAGATVMDDLDLFIDIRNITKEKAIGDVSAAITATATSAIYNPIERRAIFGGVRARF